MWTFRLTQTPLYTKTSMVDTSKFLKVRGLVVSNEMHYYLSRTSIPITAAVVELFTELSALTAMPLPQVTTGSVTQSSPQSGLLRLTVATGTATLG